MPTIIIFYLSNYLSVYAASNLIKPPFRTLDFTKVTIRYFSTLMLLCSLAVRYFRTLLSRSYNKRRIYSNVTKAILLFNMEVSITQKNTKPWAIVQSSFWLPNQQALVYPHHKNMFIKKNWLCYF